ATSRQTHLSARARAPGHRAGEPKRIRTGGSLPLDCRAMLTPADRLMALLIVVGLPLRAWFGMQALKTAPAETLPVLRRGLWRRATRSQWLSAGLVLFVWLSARRGLLALGLALRPTGGLAGVLVGVVAIVSIVLRQRASVESDEALRSRIRARLAPVERLMPRSRSDLPLFSALALTAGLCEELLFRGYLLWVAGHLLPFPVAPAAQALVFGLCHAYQGVRGVVLTTFAGAFLTLVVLVTGSLWPAMLIHALMDLHAGDLARRVYPPDPEPRGIGRGGT